MSERSRVATCAFDKDSRDLLIISIVSSDGACCVACFPPTINCLARLDIEPGTRLGFVDTV